MALLLTAIGMPGAVAQGFLEQNDARQGNITDNLLGHLGIAEGEMRGVLTQTKQQLLDAFPKTTIPGDSHSYAGFSTYPGTRVGT
eukprot:7424-Lingulodinium_polyedra.AAC.1